LLGLGAFVGLGSSVQRFLKEKPFECHGRIVLDIMQKRILSKIH
jgi:hypothetical protein